MSKELVISAPAHERRVAILEEGQLVEIYIEREKEFALVGSIYKGRVTRVLPGMQSAFVDIGLDGDAFLYVSDVFENLEQYEPAGMHPEPSAPALEAPLAGSASGPPGAEAHTSRELAGDETDELTEEQAHGAESSDAASAGPASPAAAESQIRTEDSAGNVEQRQRQNYQPPVDRGVYPDKTGAVTTENNRPHQGGQDYGRGRGRGRWGNRGGRRHGGPRQDHGRNLPPSKYASSQGYDNRGPERRGFDRAPEGPRYASPGGNTEEPIVLPGESLAKYRGRTPATMLPPDEPVAPTGEPPRETAEAAQRAADAGSAAQRSYGRLPSWVLEDASPTAEAAKSNAPETASVPEHTEAGPDLPASSFAKPSLEPATAHSESDLSEEEVASLAAQLAEAKHEESQAVAPADAVAGDELVEEEAEEAREIPSQVHEEHEEEEAIEEEREEAELAEDEAAEELAAEPAEQNGEIVEPREAEAVENSPPKTPIAQSDESLLLPGETRAPHDISRQENYRDDRPRDSARIGGSPRSRFQRPYPGRGRDRGGRYGRRDSRPPQRFERRQHTGHHGPPRRPNLISEMLKAGQDVVVQIAKEPLGKKGARITSHVALPGRFLVYMPTIDHIGVSRKIAAVENRSRLRRLVSEAKGSYPGGFIVRTAAGGATDDEVRADIEFLGKTWNEIKKKSEERKAPALLHRDLNLVERILRDYVNEDYTAIWTDSEEEYGKILEFMGRFQPKLVNRVKLYSKETPIFEEFGIQHELDKALRPKVWLKSGGYIVINHTEALVAIDVNTGKYVGKGSTRLEDTIVKTNLEAVKEIVRQIRLRDLGGIIVVDFIDMEERRNREKVMIALQQALEQDKAPSKALGFNEFGLVAITRKRTKQALERVLCQPCPYCTGSGMVKSIPTLCYEIQAEARKMAMEQEEPNLTLRVHPEVAKALKTRESMLIDELEQTTHKHVIIQSDATLHWEQYDIY